MVCGRPAAGPSAASAALLAMLLLAASTGAVAQTSRLWGRNGELWSPTGRLPDWSYAGYGAGAPRLPSNYTQAVFNVRQYGATGNGVTDDSTAFLAAIRAASVAAYNLTTDPCPNPPPPSTINPVARGRCPKAGQRGFGNEGRAGVTVLVPAGRYKVTRMLELTQSNVVVRGAGMNRTTLFFPRGLKRIYGDKMEWQWSGGFLTVSGPEINSTHTEHLISSIQQDTRKGARRLILETTSGVRAGQWVRIFAREPLSVRSTRSATRRRLGAGQRAQHAQQRPFFDSRNRFDSPGPNGFLPLSPAAEESWRQAQHLGLGSPEEPALPSGGGGGVQVASQDGTLDAYIYGENAVPSGDNPFPLERIRFASRVARVGRNWIELERPLPYDLRTKWKPAVYSFQQQVQHSGWEDFTVDFAYTPYPSHFDVEGMNGLYFTGAANAWVRNVHIINADQGAQAINCEFVTFSNIKLTHTRPRGRAKGLGHGHHGVWAAYSSNVLFDLIDVATTFIHDLTLDVWAQECVVKNSRGLDLNLDMHRGGCHNNLWSNLHLGKGSRPFASSGSAMRGSHAAANNTWWNIQANPSVLHIPPCAYGPQLGFVGPELGPPNAKRAGLPRLRSAPPPALAGNRTQAPPPGNGTGTARGAARMLDYCSQGMGWHVELVPRLLPAELHVAMLATRRARLRLQ